MYLYEQKEAHSYLNTEKEAVTVDKEKKIAVPNLEIGDIIDFYNSIICREVKHIKNQYSDTDQNGQND